VRLSDCQHPLRPIDADLDREAGMDGNLARLLQAARDLDIERAEAEKLSVENLDTLLAPY
jgi:hypothetical protein